MAIVIISSVAVDTRRELSEGLARKLGCPYLSREELVERATEAGIPVGKLEMSVLKRTVPRERLARHKSRYLAFVTAAICEKAIQNRDIVYHGRAGNLLLPGVDHVLRIRVLPHPGRRIQEVMNRLNLSREKAVEYIKGIDEDVSSWFQFAHGVEINDLSQYDLVLNLGQMSIESATAMICSMAQLPDFHDTPASRRTLEDLWLAARARDRLSRDEATAGIDLNVTAQEGRLTVTYMPGQAHASEDILSVLKNLEGAREVVCTMAVTNILWVGESFDSTSSAFQAVTDLARRWNAAVELFRLLSPANGVDPSVDMVVAPSETSSPDVCIPKAQDLTGGIEDDHPESPVLPDGGLDRTSEGLINEGLFGGSQTTVGGADQVIKAVKAQPNYSMIVVGRLFSDKGHAAQVRLTRELCSVLVERTRKPVMTAEEIQAKISFGSKQMVQLFTYLAIVAAIYFLVFVFQDPILNFLGGPAWKSWRLVAVASIAGIVPLIAYLYGGAMDLFLKWLRFE